LKNLKSRKDSYLPINLNLLLIIPFIIVFLILSENNIFSGNGATNKNLFNIILKGEISKDDRNYLVINKNKSIQLDDIKASLIIIELFNTYCTICSQNMKILNDVFISLEKNKQLDKKIKIIAIASGNNENEIKEYKKNHNIKFPIFIDYDFKIHTLLGNPRVPYTIFIKKPDKKVVHIHQGLFNSSNEIIEKINEIIITK
jgi:peroxiredoxin